MKKFKKALALLLSLSLVLGMIPASALTAFGAEGETTYVLAGSDFQASSHNAGATIVSGLLDKIKVDYPTMDGFLFAGDYDVNYNDSANGKAKLQETVQAVYGTGMDEIYVQGNHDSDSLVGSTLTASGANDAENYGVFVINEKDYMWYNNDEATIKKTAENLETYLNAKRNAGYTKPIFVMSHLPLHYSMRTRSGGNDGMHANYIFDVLNEAGNAGLNIIFMFGHNHSHGWDDYLGGAAIFLTKGDNINIAQNSTTVFQEETLAFTYMNAGYVGYYGTSYTSDVDKTLTMTTFAITDTDVTVSRYDSNGTHDLKSAGVYNVEYPDSAYYSTDTTTVGTPYTLKLNTEITPAGEEVAPPESGTATSIEQVTSLEKGVPYIIVCNRNNLVLTGTADGSKLKLSGEASVNTTDLWYYDGTHLIYGDPNTTSNYLLLRSGEAYLGETHDYRMVDNVYLNNDGKTFTLKRTDDGLCLNQYGGSNATVAAGYAADGNHDNGSKWRIYKVVEGTETPSVNITGYRVQPEEGTVSKGASQIAQTGALIYVTLENETYYTVPVTVNMLTKADGSAVSTGEIGTIENLTLMYNDVVITENFTLNVEVREGNNYPEYPNEGAVKVNKTATGIDFQSSGIAQVEVSASGVPMKKGADVIVMLDLSSSMHDNKVTVNGNQVTRLAVLEDSLESLMEQLKANGDDGQPMDIRLAVADFNRYYPNSSSPYYINSLDHLKDGSIRTNSDGTNKVYTGSYGLDAGAFVSVHDLDINEFDGLGYKSGTNYDYAFDAIYQLGEAITTKNATDGVERDLFVIFMSDGAPFQYNYFSAQSGSSSGTTAARYWNNWLQGTMTEDMFDSNARNDYYNEDGKHWMAEAIKGDPATTYPVIRKNNAADTDGDTWVNVNGLGAKMYSIGFCLAKDKEITVASMDTVIRNIASSEQYYFRANSAADLNNAFTSIGGDIAYAAYNARFVDQMGDNYDLQLKTSTYKVVENGEEKEKTLAPVIEILAYDIYTKAEADAGQIPTGKNIGDRKGTSALKEVVKFSDDGTKAYSNLIDVDKDGTYGVTVNADGTYTISDVDDNILGTNGVISATTFWYNTTNKGVEIKGVNIPTGKDSANLTTGSTNVLPAETFYWKMGTVQTSELAMRYYVYLDGSMEGTREAGSYPTNEYATLYYDNYLHNPCYKDTVSPVLAWKSANVSYAFYLVNENGEIVVNQTTGETGTFANKVAVTNAVVYKEILLNNTDQVQAIKVADVENSILPLGYELYDKSAEYEVSIKSNSAGGWTINKGNTVNVQSTYVTQYKTDDASAYSNALKNETIGDDYTHTVVWFAVLWKVQALPDTVVIDYGLPVDISVLTNDMFGENGKLAGIGAYNESLNLEGHDDALASGFGNNYTGTYGGATTTLSTGKVRYTLNKDKGMQMQTYEKFAYAVNYTGSENAGFYYDTVTVIPATTIYYEDDFLTYSASNTEWKDEGTAMSGVTQEEDRPGQYSLTDANNIYGFDSVNNGMSTFSLGTAKKVHVDADSSATASFTFYGTGFDVVGMTSNTTGTIAVKVTAAEDIVVNGETKYANGDKVKATMVNTYYGYTTEEHEILYTYTNGAWVSEDKGLKTDKTVVTTKPENPKEGDTFTAVEQNWVAAPATENSLYQVPVMQIEELPYGKYNVLITATYAESLDKTTADGYDLYIDAIRIYDPANDGAVDSDTVIEEAYKADGESWPSYIELRNKIIAAESFDKVANDALTTDMEGLVFIDGDANIGDAQIADYIGYGPNNEVYLAPGQSIAFMLSVPASIKNVHMGIKSVDSNGGTYTIKNIAKQDIVEANTVKVEAGKTYNEKVSVLNTTTDMYYDITGWKNDIIVITNTGGSGIISLTNIKSTYTSDPNGVMPASLEDELSVTETEVYMTPEAATLTLRTLNTPAEEDAPEVDVPETPGDDPVVEPEEPGADENGSVSETVNKIVTTIANAVKKLFGWLFV